MKRNHLTLLKSAVHLIKPNILQWMMVLGLLICSLADIQAQTVEISSSCSPDVDGSYTLQADVNGRPSFVNGNFSIEWSGTRWENVNTSGVVGSFNTLDTPYPPASSLQAWTPNPVAVNCFPPGIFSGNGTCCTLDCTIMCPSNNHSIPTLSEWGLIILALLFMTLGTLYLLEGQGRYENG